MSNEYNIIEDTSDKCQKQLYWDVAIGLNKVDNLHPSKYLMEVAELNVEGKLSLTQVEEKLKDYYTHHKEKVGSSEYECDIVSKRIVDLISQKAFSFSVPTLMGIHKYLFSEVLNEEITGKFRTYNISKEEDVLNGKTVIYANYNMIKDTLEYDFNEESKYRYSFPFSDSDIDNISKFTSNIWQVHPFGEGNTRTVAVFLELYLNSLGYQINNDLFKNHSKYFRNALVRNNYYNAQSNISPEDKYLKQFFKRLLGQEMYELKDEELICKKLFNQNRCLLNENNFKQIDQQNYER